MDKDLAELKSSPMGSGIKQKGVMENEDHKTIRYFGYGANASQEMIEAIIGRKPSGVPARLENYELWIQSRNEIDIKTQKILSRYWNVRNFKTYSIRPNHGKVVNGILWFLTPAEREKISRWEFWYKPIKVNVRLGTGEVVEAETEMVDVISGSEAVDGENYPNFLNDKNEMLRVATQIKKYKHHKKAGI